MSQELRAAAVTSQLISFARVQLQLLDSPLNAFQARAVKQAFAMQASAALQSYLEEIQLITADKLDTPPTAISFVANIRNCLENSAGDFRAQELQNILKDEKSWLALLLFLREASMQAGEKESEVKTKSQNDDNLIIAVAVSESTPDRRWWEYSRQELSAVLDQMQALISRQREHSVEE